MQKEDNDSNIEVVDSIIEEQKYLLCLDKLTEKRNTTKLKIKFSSFNNPPPPKKMKADFLY